MAIEKTSSAEERRSDLWDTVRIIVHALILAVLIRIFLFQPFNIPSGSMKGTLLVGDYLFVTKYSYGYSHHSFPFSPKMFLGRIWKGEPKRGDVAVFKNPVSGEDYIKRVIGMPNDEVKMTEGVLFINGKAVPKKRVEDFIGRDRYGRTGPIPQFMETLPNGVQYKVLDEVKYGQLDTTRIYKVPAGHYFMMGDNRDNSADSRVTRDVGPVPLENFVGRADRLFFSIDEAGSWLKFWRWPSDIRWSRIFSAVR